MATHNDSHAAGIGRTIARWVRRVVLLLVVAGVAWAAWSATRPVPPDVPVHTVADAPMEVRVRADGVTRIKDRFVLSAPAYGQVTRIALRPGDRVGAGDLVARVTAAPSALLDVRSRAEIESRIDAARAAWRQAQSLESLAGDAVEFARTERDRVRNLRDRGIGTDADVAAADFAVRSREADESSAEFATRVALHNLAMAEATLEPQTGTDGMALDVTSPIDGVVLRVVQEHAGVVQPGTPLIEIGDPTAVEVVADVLTTDAVRIAPGAPVRLERWGGEGPVAGHVRSIEPQAFTRLSALGVEEQRVNLIIDVDAADPAWERLGDGWRVEASVLVWSAASTLQVPLNAVFRRGDGWALYAVEDDTVVTRAIELGQRDGRNAEVLGGLTAGEEVVLYPTDAIGPGTVIAPVREGSAE
jgi:HlyD family secretion protein